MIALLTDFGTRDYFVASMKGVILSINPLAAVVDITHEVPPQDVWTGAFILKSAYKWFPEGTIFVAVVDPGVGTERAPLLLETNRYFFIGPDNGLLSLAADEDGVKAAYRIEARLPAVSRTFHGRDVFAPAAAYLSLGVPPYMLGSPLSSWKRLEAPRAAVKDGALYASAIYSDRFGNVYTSAGASEALQLASYGDWLCVEAEGRSFRAKFVETYGRAQPGDVVALINSEGYLEIAVVMGNAREALGLKPGAGLRITKC
ncbi:MAG: S-adenosyl-l-methionine hydroxide adenosyltransferase family protein [Thermoproteus sp. AZ2]|uniref:S-adenosyl-l-methionine hydroxide adenosyltransferase family protein n=1 Tax=Thermoproteus sp. AZ2 TaxID=1609232 RepID=A0ACC6V109_9CREN